MKRQRRGVKPMTDKITKAEAAKAAKAANNAFYAVAETWHESFDEEEVEFSREVLKELSVVFNYFRQEEELAQNEPATTTAVN